MIVLRPIGTIDPIQEQFEAEQAARVAEQQAAADARAAAENAAEMQRREQLMNPPLPTKWIVAGLLGSAVTIGLVTTAIILIIRAAKKKGS